MDAKQRRAAGLRTGLLAIALSLPALAARADEIRGRVLDARGEGVADAVVFVIEAPAGVEAAGAPPTAIMDQVNKEFVPHVLPVALGTEVRFPNHDQIHHHVYSFSRSKVFEIPLYKGEAAPPVRFDAAGAVKIGCNIHDWMSAVILVVPNRFFAKTDETGAFRIADLPAGRHPVALWHERSEVPPDDTRREVDTAGGEVTFRLELPPPRPRPGAHGMRGWE
jgi:plastocyanin